MQPSEPQYDILTSDKSRNLFLAGVGSGKTHCAGGVSANFISNFPHVWGMIAANTHGQLNNSTLFRIRAAWEEEFGIKEFDPISGDGCYVVGIKPPAHFITKGHNFKSYNNIISFNNGCVVFMGSLENYKAIDGMQFGWAILDETKDTKEEAVKEVIIARLRQPGMYINAQGELVDTNGDECTPYNPLFIFTSPAKVQWLNEWFGLEEHETEIKQKIHTPGEYFKVEKGNMLVTISSTHLNLHNLPSNYIDELKSSLNSALFDMLVHANPFSKAGGEFYKCFDREMNTGHHTYNDQLPIWLTWDFNVKPYVTCNVWQFEEVGEEKRGRQIDEICLKSPKNRTEDACNEFIRRYPDHAAGLFITGDPAGRSEDTRSVAGSNDYTIILRLLAKYSPKQRVASIAPPVVMRGNFINSIFEKRYGGIDLSIDKSCTNTINDYTYLKEAGDGTKDKEKAKDPDTKKSYEKYGHTSDANDYLLCQVYNKEFLRFQSLGKPMKRPLMSKGPISKHSY